MDARTLIGHWPTVVEFAAAVGVPYSRANKWWQRNRISSDALYACYRAAKARGVEVTAEQILAGVESPAA